MQNVYEVINRRDEVDSLQLFRVCALSCLLSQKLIRCEVQISDKDTKRVTDDIYLDQLRMSVITVSLSGSIK